jgi:hypothetical protein
VRGLDIPVVDIDATFRASPDVRQLFYSWRSHYNPAGYRVVAEAVVDHLETQGPVDRATDAR